MCSVGWICYGSWIVAIASNSGLILECNGIKAIGMVGGVGIPDCWMELFGLFVTLVAGNDRMTGDAADLVARRVGSESDICTPKTQRGLVMHNPPPE